MIVSQQSNITTQPPQVTNRLATHESIEPMDHISHPVSGQSQATHHQPHLRRRSRQTTLRTQRRLLSRILRRRSTHSTPSDLRGYLRTLAVGRNSGRASNPITPSPSDTQIAPTLPQRSQPQPGPALTVINHLRLHVPRDFTGPWPLTTAHCLYEPTMNSLCGKPIPHPRTKPVIVEDTTCGVSLLTGTISGSNFAFP